VQRAAQLAGQVADQSLFGGAQLAVRRPVGQPADGRTISLQRDAGAGTGGLVGAGDGGAVQAADADLAQVQPGGQLGDGGLQQPVDIGGGFQALTQTSYLPLKKGRWSVVLGSADRRGLVADGVIG
jgi:hypothetical protein